jgi:phosphoribosyl-ATP pyrophosphohydrolase/phosphoribosyl-AMP cyclohydrolase
LCRVFLNKYKINYFFGLRITCFSEKNDSDLSFLKYLQELIYSRKNDSPKDSYTASLFSKGVNKIAQKVGEEATELVIEAKDDNLDLFLGEAADLMYHYLVLLAFKDVRLED